MGGFSEPSDRAGSKPWPIIRVEGFSLRPPISSTSGLGRRRGVVPVRSDSSSMVKSPRFAACCMETEPASREPGSGPLGERPRGEVRCPRGS